MSNRLVIVPVVVAIVYLAVLFGSETVLVLPDLHESGSLVIAVFAAGLGIVALVRHLSTGQTQALSLAAGVLGFAAFYAWKGLLTAPDNPYYFLYHGILARMMLAIALINAIGPGYVVAATDRGRLVLGAIGLGIALFVMGGLLATPIAWLVEVETPERLEALRRLMEAVTIILTLVAIVRVVRRMEQLGRQAGLAVLIGALLVGERSLFVVTNAPWTLGWWLGQVVGIVAVTVVVWAVLSAIAPASFHQRSDAGKGEDSD